jgi:hypothetical protein
VVDARTDATAGTSAAAQIDAGGLLNGSEQFVAVLEAGGDPVAAVAWRLQGTGIYIPLLAVRLGKCSTDGKPWSGRGLGRFMLAVVLDGSVCGKVSHVLRGAALLPLGRA